MGPTSSCGIIAGDCIPERIPHSDFPATFRGVSHNVHFGIRTSATYPIAAIFGPNNTQTNFGYSTSWRLSWEPNTRKISSKNERKANTNPHRDTVRNNSTKEKAPKETDAAPRVNIQDFCEEHYEDILSVIMDKKFYQIRKKEVHTWQDFGTNTRDQSNKNERKLSKLKHGHRSRDRGPVLYHERGEDKRVSAIPYSLIDEEELAVPSDIVRGDPKDHVKKFQAAKQVECWAMPTWCHMFNSTLIGTARVWFNELPPESINGYKDLKAAFLAYFMQQKKYVKDPVEIHNIKQRDGETLEDFMKRFKVETGRMKGAPECMQVSGFMHGVNNPELTKRLNEHVPKTMEEMMTITTAFIRGETAATSKKKGYAP
ncbi:reverse transcriptase domain-containing protein [Tanacetum coccineum]